MMGDWSSKRGEGQGITFLRGLVGHTGEECVKWPLFIDPRRGYGVLGYNGGMFKAHRLMCELANGEPPAGDYEAAHTCNNPACVNPNHLGWKTRVENQQDRRQNGTAGNGGTGRRRKLTPEQATYVRGSLETNTDLAERFGVTRSAIRQIRLGKTHMTILNRDRIAVALRGMKRPMRADEISRIARIPNQNSVNSALLRMLKDGEVIKVGRGTWRAPVL